MEATEINADNYPIGDGKIIRLLSVDRIKKLPKGTVLYSVGGVEVTTGKDEMDLETHVFGRSKYGELNEPIDVGGGKKKKKKVA